MSLSRVKMRQVDPYLTTLMVAYANRPDTFIANQVLPFLNTGGKRSGRYRKFTKENFRNYEDKRAPSTMGNKIEFDLDTDGTFKLTDRSLWDGIDDTIRQEFMGELPVEEITSRFLVDARMVAREKRVANLVQSGTYLTNYSALTSNDRWDVYTSSSSNPKEDIKTMRQSIWAATATKMNTIIMGYQVFDALQLHPLILESVKYVMATTNKNMTAELLASYFGVEKVLVGYPLVITTDEGQSITLAAIWGKNVIGAHIEPKPTNMTRTLGFTPTTKKGGAGHEMLSYYDNDRESQIIKIRADESEELVDVECAYLFNTVIS